MELLAIAGVSGREGEVMRFMARRLRQTGMPAGAIRFDRVPHPSPQEGETGNLVLRLPGTQPGRRRLLMAHVDTVPLCQGARPVRRGRYIVPADKRTGLGADDRAGTAVLLAVALEILRRDLPHPPLSFFWTVQEEIGLYGARHARLGLLGRPHLAVQLRRRLGRQGHRRRHRRLSDAHPRRAAWPVMRASAPEKGVSAIAIAALAIAQLHREGWHGRIEKDGRRGTSNVGVIHGGEATNVVTPEVDLRAEARSHDPAFRRKIVRAIERAFEKAARASATSPASAAKCRSRGGSTTSRSACGDDEPCVVAAEAAVRRCGGEPVRAVSNGGLDANWMTARGIPTVTLGCGQENGHTVSERLDLTDFAVPAGSPCAWQPARSRSGKLWRRSARIGELDGFLTMPRKNHGS